MTTKLSSTFNSDPAGPNKALLGRSLAFVATLSVVLGCLNAWAGRVYVSEIELKYRAMYQRERSFERIAMGTSRVSYGIVPRAFDAAGQAPLFNFGFNAASAAFTADWYDTFRQYHAAPKLVLLGLDWNMIRPTKGSRRLERDSAYMPPDLLFKTARRRDVALMALVTNFFPLLRERDRYQVDLLGLNHDHNGMAAYDDGFVPLSGPRRDMSPFPFPPVDPAQLDLLDGLLERMRKEGAAVVLVQTPEYRTPVHEAESHLFGRLAGKHHLPFLDYNAALRSEFNDDADNYIDWHHLNARGAEVYSRRLRRDLEGLKLPGWRQVPDKTL